ncbi:MAG TPA: DUF1641 domain-containing protein [Granulicella sp.]|jgi:uncharacterized protein YjgD (DUF1641 family)|nr:DUF1641 domain-containing protein [Granulicella sp.]
MSIPLRFKPLPVDRKRELQRQLDAAPIEHAEALLVLWNLLETAHEKGILDLVDGMIGAKDAIADTLARYAATPEGIAGLRNLLVVVKLAGTLDPEQFAQLTTRLAPALSTAAAQHQQESTPPSLWQILRRTTSEDGRRGLSFLTLMLSGLGRSLK